MKARALYQLLEAPESGDALRSAIAPAMPAYRHGLAERGRTAPIAVRTEGVLLVVAAEHLVVLCEAFLAGQLDPVELGYIASALELAPDFQFVSERIEDITNLLARGTATPEAVTAVLRLLREHAA